MNFAEGYGPKTVKKVWPTGQFVTLYGNGTASGVVNPATPPYPTPTIWGTPSGTVPGSMNPGLNVASGVNNNTDVSFICAFDSTTGANDATLSVVNLTAESGFKGPSTVVLQGSMIRYGTVASNWVAIASTTVSSGQTSYTMAASVSGSIWNAYRLVASGGTGIIDWSIAGMFLDISAQGIGNNALDTNGNVGQLTINNPRVLTLSGGVITVVSGVTPYANTKSDGTWIG